MSKNLPPTSIVAEMNFTKTTPNISIVFYTGLYRRASESVNPFLVYVKHFFSVVFKCYL